MDRPLRGSATVIALGSFEDLQMKSIKFGLMIPIFFTDEMRLHSAPPSLQFWLRKTQGCLTHVYDSEATMMNGFFQKCDSLGFGFCQIAGRTIPHTFSLKNLEWKNKQTKWSKKNHLPLSTSQSNIARRHDDAVYIYVCDEMPTTIIHMPIFERTIWTKRNENRRSPWPPPSSSSEYASSTSRESNSKKFIFVYTISWNERQRLELDSWIPTTSLAATTTTN